MIPDKIQWFMGYNGLALNLEQERKHWLLKTDKKKQVQDKKTGDVFQGQIDNIGSDIIIESEKLPIKNDVIQSIAYSNPSANKILSADYSAFTYSSMVNGLMFARITSTNFPLRVGNNTTFKHYKMKLKDCVECIILFGGSVNSSEVFASKWIKTTTPPSLLMLDDSGEYSIEQRIEFTANITNPVFYYPLTENIQPLDLTDEGSGIYTTEAVNDDGFIGYPLYWFTCDQSNVGPTLSITNNTNERNEQLMFISNEGNSSKYNAKLYVDVDGSFNATPDGSETDNYTITCKCKNGYTFKNNDNDFNIPIDSSSISMYDDTSTMQSYALGIICSDKDVITMSENQSWTYIDEQTYSIRMNVFDSNCLASYKSPLISVFNVHFDEDVPFTNMTNDTGYAGISMGSSNMTSDVYVRYPHDLNKWDGLPEWMNDMDDGAVPQHMAIYAIHNTPTYTPDIPDSRQVAALLLDPGLMKTDDSDASLSNDERGRIYVLSNDDTEYKNNAKETYPKPARTVARICDVPTSVMQLSGISGLAPTSIVDKKYVRTQTSFNVEDKDRLYNILGDRWVKPTSLDSNGNTLMNTIGQDNEFIFNRLSTLNNVDLLYHNDFREYENINPLVDPMNVGVGSITDPGSGYSVDDIGVVVVGGFAFHYTIMEVDDSGSVLKTQVTPASEYMINLSNFDMVDGNAGITEPYGTSPLTGSGTGLRFRFIINDYVNILPYKGEIFDNLYAFVKENDGLWLYNYIINDSSTASPKNGTWTKNVLVSQFEQSTTYQTNGGVATSEAYMNSIIPSLKNVPVSQGTDNLDPVTLTTLSTASFINVVDKTKTPVVPVSTSSSTNDSDIKHVDMCKFYCDGVMRLRAAKRTDESVISAMKSNNKLRYDSYVFWKWESESDRSNLYFICGVIHRSFNNLLTTDFTTTLPINELKCNLYVHSNPGTTIVWDVDNIGVMMWMYNPNYQKHEIYRINPATRDLYIDKKDLSWDEIDIRDSRSGKNISLIENGKLVYNILTNNPIQARNLDPDMTNPDPVYLQPDFVQLDDLKKGTIASSIIKEHQPIGDWQLVFPRINSFKLSNLRDGREFTPMKMNMIRGNNLGDVTEVTDSYGNNVNAKSLIIDETENGVVAKIYNSETGKWESIIK
jgi:hypothetical protein